MGEVILTPPGGGQKCKSIVFPGQRPRPQTRGLDLSILFEDVYTSSDDEQAPSLSSRQLTRLYTHTRTRTHTPSPTPTRTLYLFVPAWHRSLTRRRLVVSCESYGGQAGRGSDECVSTPPMARGTAPWALGHTTFNRRHGRRGKVFFAVVPDAVRNTRLPHPRFRVSSFEFAGSTKFRSLFVEPLHLEMLLFRENFRS
jgi:hypothetical protein